MKAAILMREKLNRYYYCLNMRKDSLKIFDRITARAKVVPQGQNRVRLYPYGLCVNPLAPCDVIWTHKHPRRPLDIIYPNYLTIFLSPSGSLELIQITSRD